MFVNLVKLVNPNMQYLILVVLPRGWLLVLRLVEFLHKRLDKLIRNRRSEAQQNVHLIICTEPGQCLIYRYKPKGNQSLSVFSLSNYFVLTRNLLKLTPHIESKLKFDSMYLNDLQNHRFGVSHIPKNYFVNVQKFQLYLHLHILWYDDLISTELQVIVTWVYIFVHTYFILCYCNLRQIWFLFSLSKYIRFSLKKRKEKDWSFVKYFLSATRVVVTLKLYLW